MSLYQDTRHIVTSILTVFDLNHQCDNKHEMLSEKKWEHSHHFSLQSFLISVCCSVPLSVHCCSHPHFFSQKFYITLKQLGKKHNHQSNLNYISSYLTHLSPSLFNYKTASIIFLRPNKNICVVPVTLPTLLFSRNISLP